MSKAFDPAQHYLLIFTQVTNTNGQPFVRIDTSMANYEGEPTNLNNITITITTHPNSKQ